MSSSRVKRILLLFVYCVHEVGGINAFIGDTALLPCIHDDVSIFHEGAVLFWTDQDDDIMVEIKGNKTRIFRERVESFPHLYDKGNFSIVIRNVQQSDNNPYDCQIPRIFFRKRVYLTVLGRPVGKEATATPPPGSSHGTVATAKSLHVTLLSLLLSLLFGHH